MELAGPPIGRKSQSVADVESVPLGDHSGYENRLSCRELVQHGLLVVRADGELESCYEGVSRWIHAGEEKRVATRFLSHEPFGSHRKVGHGTHRLYPRDRGQPGPQLRSHGDRGSDVEVSSQSALHPVLDVTSERLGHGAYVHDHDDSHHQSGHCQGGPASVATGVGAPHPALVAEQAYERATEDPLHPVRNRGGEQGRAH